jgi:hypothetical protein
MTTISQQLIEKIAGQEVMMAAIQIQVAHIKDASAGNTPDRHYHRRHWVGWYFNFRCRKYVKSGSAKYPSGGYSLSCATGCEE